MGTRVVADAVPFEPPTGAAKVAGVVAVVPPTTGIVAATGADGAAGLVGGVSLAAGP